MRLDNESANAYQCARPEHALRINDKVAKESSDTETKQLSRDDKQVLVASRELLTKVELLGGDDFGSICTIDDNRAHDGNQNMLLDVEGAGVERNTVTQDPKLLRRKHLGKCLSKRERSQLDDDSSDQDGGVCTSVHNKVPQAPTSHGHDLVDTRHGCSKEDTQHPHTESVGRHGRIILRAGLLANICIPGERT